MYSDTKETNERHRCIFQFIRKLHSHLLPIAVTVAIRIFSGRLSLSLSCSLSPIQARNIWFQSILSALSSEFRMQHSIYVYVWNGVCALLTAVCTMSGSDSSIGITFRQKHGLQLIFTKYLPFLANA